MRNLYIWLLFINASLSGQSTIDTTAFSVDMDEYIITAQYEPTHYKKSIHRVDVIDREDISRLGAITLDEALLVSPAIQLTIDPILGTAIKMRGIGSNNVAILIDNVPVIGRNDGAIDLTTISLQNVERIEIVEGPLSNLYGNNAAGGVINLVTKSSQINKWKFATDHQVESIGRRNHVASIGYSNKKVNIGIHGRSFMYNQYIIDSLRVQEIVSYSDGTTGQVSKYPFNPKEQNNYGAFIKYRINNESSLTIKYDEAKESLVDYGIVKRAQYNPYAIDELYETKRKDLSLSYNAVYDNKFYVDVVASYNRFSRNISDKRYFIDSSGYDDELLEYDSTVFNQIYVKSVLNYTGFKNWTLGAGYNFTREEGEGNRLGNVDEGITSPQLYESAFFSDFKYSGIENLKLSLGQRYIHHSIYNDEWTYSFQSKYDLNNHWTLRASYAHGYRNPSLKELYLQFVDVNHNILGNGKLTTEASDDIQSTLTYMPNDNWEWSLNGYYTSISNKIDLVEYEPLMFRYENIDSYYVIGLQPSIAYKTKIIKVNTSLSLRNVSSSYEDEEDIEQGNVLDVNTSIHYSVEPLGIHLFFNHKHIGSQPIFQSIDDEIVVNRISSYEMFNVSASKSFLNNHLKLYFGVNNLLDRQYTLLKGQSQSTHSIGARNIVDIGRSFYIKVGLEF